MLAVASCAAAALLLTSSQASPSSGHSGKQAFTFSVPKMVSSASGTGYLDQMDPTAGSVVEGSIDGISQDPAAIVETASLSSSEYRLRYHASTPTLVRAAVPTFPGWRAIGPSGELPVRIVDHAFMGFVVPKGEGEVLLRFRPPYFWLGASVSVLTLLTVIGLAFGRLPRKAPAAAGEGVLR